jgi:hypothetical protein
MYFRSRGVITDDQIILGLGIQPEKRPGDDAHSEGVRVEDLPDARQREDQYLQQNLDGSGASSPADTKATHTDSGSGHQDHTLGLEIYDDNNPSKYSPSP